MMTTSSGTTAARACACSCCAEYEAQVTASRVPMNFCSCSGHPRDQQCDCRRCAAALITAPVPPWLANPKLWGLIP